MSRTEGRLSRGESKEFAPAILTLTINGPVRFVRTKLVPVL